LNQSLYVHFAAPNVPSNQGFVAAQAGSVLVHVPEKLLISPPKALASDIGDILSGCDGLFLSDDDLMLTLFLLWQRHLGAASFWAAYLRALPTPTSILNWTAEQLVQLQDAQLVAKARSRESAMRNKHTRMLAALQEHFPQRLPPSALGYPAFRWAWMTVQARAFGRRLPWTALVPFADSLNHSNTPVKYDFNESGNSAFRLFSSGGPGIAAGAEVFNSYGRRSNQHLALEYGFVMPNNEWAHASVQLRKGGALPHSALVHLSRAQLPLDGLFRCSWNKWNTKPLEFLRVCLADEGHLGSCATAELLEACTSWPREVASLQALLDVYAAALAAFPTSLEDDLTACKAVGSNFESALDWGVLKAALGGANVPAGSAALMSPTAALVACASDMASSLHALVAEGQTGVAPGSVDDVLLGSAEQGAARLGAALVHRCTTKLILAQQCAWSYTALLTARMAAASGAAPVGSGKSGIPPGSPALHWAQGVLSAAEMTSAEKATGVAPVMAPVAASATSQGAK
jgi:hypothetical protein